MTPRVSVLLPVRDGEAWLDACLDSLAAQTLDDHEVVVHDDGSRDGTAEILARRAAADPRVRVQRGEPAGIVQALQEAASRATAPLLARMDADDVAHPERLERLVALLDRRPDVDLVGSRMRYVPRPRRADGLWRYERWLDACLEHAPIVRARYVECPLPHPTWALRRALFDALGGYREGPFAEDYDFFLRAAQNGARFAKLPQVLMLQRDRPGRLSRTDPRCSLAAFRALKARHVTADPQLAGRPLVVEGTPKAARRWVRALREAGRSPEQGSGPPFVLVAHGVLGSRDAERTARAARGALEGRDWLFVQ
ncbi:MAG: glycosyltransferase [Planctomycetes bacterium]|nr:glycosyltransferase [Planctomycetota bacterium]MCB9824873.1 glycosyltransferase [Planctomycetota bacterium]MCB9901721.1 glycosyltransferase [Planctomycetota bacterium]